MANIQNAIVAEIFDISRTAPSNTDGFLVDSNVWLWMTYSNVGLSVPAWRGQIIQQYASFVGDASTVNAKLFWNGLSLAELAHLIEKNRARNLRNIQWCDQGKGIPPQHCFRKITGCIGDSGCMGAGHKPGRSAIGID